MKINHSLLKFATIIIFISSCKAVKINEDNYAWKSFDSSEKDQTIDLNNYSSPNDREGQNKNKVVIVCASGGGSRAASFTTGIMLELEKILIEKDASTKSNALNEVDYFSTVSGGGWGASSYIAYLYQKNKYCSPAYKKAISDYNKTLSSDEYKEFSIEDFPTFNSYEKYLANRANFRYYKHQIGYLLTFRNAKSDMVMTNRLNAGYLGWSYRKYIEENTWYFMHPTSPFYESDVEEITLGDVFKTGGEKCYMPMLIANTTNIDNYKLVPFTPDRLNYWGVNKYRHYLNRQFTVITNSNPIYEIPLASGTKASSGIPFALASSTFPATKKDNYSNRDINYYLHLQDGGIIDQQGMHTAKAILSHHSEIKGKENRIVIVIDASSTGIENKKKFKKNNARRFYNLWRVIAPFSTPDAQYALTRERIKLFEQEYNCTVIYLGTEVLLDKSINAQTSSNDNLLPNRKKKVENYFFSKYDSVKNNTNGFLTFSLKDRSLLYAYISQNVSTWFASYGSKFKGRILAEDNSSAKIMFLAGRGVVQLKRNQIETIFK